MPKVLLVEDDEFNRDMLSRRLTRKGFEVTIAVDGQQGVDMSRSATPDVVLMDVSLPVLDGLSAVRAIRQDPASANLRIIALTAHAMESDRQNALAAGCDDFDTKPVDLERLLSKIQALLAR